MNVRSRRRLGHFVAFWIALLSAAFLVAFGISVTWWVEANESALGWLQAVRLYTSLLSFEADGDSVLYPTVQSLLSLWALALATASLGGAVVTWRWLTPADSDGPVEDLDDLDHLLAVERHLQEAEESGIRAEQAMAARIRKARKEAHDAFHLLWSRVGSGAPYDKQAWSNLKAHLDVLGVGPGNSERDG